MSTSVGFDINKMFESTMDSISNKGEDLMTKMETLAEGEELSSEQMLALQFEVGQYNALLESLSTITKSMTDMLKSVAQRSN